MDRDLRIAIAGCVAILAVLSALVLTGWMAVPAQHPGPQCRRWHQAIGGSFYVDPLNGDHSGGVSVAVVCDDQIPPAQRDLEP